MRMYEPAIGRGRKCQYGSHTNVYTIEATMPMNVRLIDQRRLLFEEQLRRCA